MARSRRVESRRVNGGEAALLLTAWAADARTPFRSDRSGSIEVSAARNTIGEERHPLGYHRM